MSNFDELWTGNLGGSRTWYSSLEDAPKAWLESVADEIIARGGKEPFWRVVHTTFDGLHGKAPSVTTMASTVRRLVKDRSDV